MHDELMIANRTLRAQPRSGGKTLSFDIRLPWYRSLPISCVENLAFEIDGQAFPRERVSMTICGSVYDLDGVSRLCDAQWFVLDTHEVLLEIPQALESGDHDVKLITRLRIPYKDDSYEDTDYIQFAVCQKNLEMEAQ